MKIGNQENTEKKLEHLVVLLVHIIVAVWMVSFD